MPSPRHSRRVPLAPLVAASVLATLLPVLWVTAPPAGAVSAPAVPDTAYPYPTNALFVAPGGADTNPGTIGSPLRTIGAAKTKAAAGATIVVRAGTYREALGVVSKRLTIQPYPHETVWLKGSAVVTAWTASGGRWLAPWTVKFCHTCYNSAAIDPQYPNAGFPDQVFVDGVSQRQVTSTSAVVAGTFFADYTNGRLVVGSDPTGHTIEASNASSVIDLVPGSDGTIIRGIGIAQYAPTWNTSNVPAAVIVDAPNVTLENVVVTQSAARGVAVFDSNDIVRSSNVSGNGYTGIIGNAANGLLVDQSYLTSNNTEHFSIAATGAAASAGIKVTSSKGVTVRDSVVSDNIGNGIWFDISSYSITVVRNVVLRNAVHGISIELSTTAVVASNLVTDNALFGIKVTGTTNSDVWNNTLVNNGAAQLAVIEDPRKNTNSTEISLGMTWDTANIRIENNLVQTSINTANPLLYTLDANSPKSTSASMMVGVLDGNSYSRTNALNPAVLANWNDAAGNNANYKTLPALKTATGREGHGWALDASVTPFFVNLPARDLALMTDSTANGSGNHLNTAVANALGRSTTAAVDRGALAWPGMPPKDARPVASMTKTCVLLQCTFDGSGSTDADGSITAYRWTFGDGSTATGVRATHQYAAHGTYQVTLTATDLRGAAGVVSVMLNL